MDRAYPHRTHIVIRALEKDTSQFRPRQEGEDVLELLFTFSAATPPSLLHPVCRHASETERAGLWNRRWQ
jgi:hypothetical protein